MTTLTFQNRIVVAEKATQKVMGFLLWNGINVMETGQEKWLPKWVHDRLRTIHDDSRINMLRHFPDLDTGKVLLQVKNAPDGDEYPTVTLERDSYDTCFALYECGISVLMIWLLSDNKSLAAEWVQNIKTKEPNTPRQDTNGSHTPYYIVHKDNLKPLREFLGDLK